MGTEPKRPEAVIAELERVLGDSTADGCSREALAYLVTERPHDALAVLARGLAGRLSCPQTRDALARAHTALVGWRTAAAEVTRLLAADPAHAETVVLLGTALVGAGERAAVPSTERPVRRIATGSTPPISTAAVEFTGEPPLARMSLSKQAVRAVEERITRRVRDDRADD